jgi:protein-disulfide isomerase
MARRVRRLALAAAALALAAGPALAGVPADAVKGDMSLGDPQAKVQVTEYASAACPHCAHFDETVFPEFKARYIDTGRVRYTLKEFLTSPAQVAAAGFLLARCGGTAKYFPILHAVFKSQADWKPDNLLQVFNDVGKANGLSEAQVQSCLADQAALDALNERVKAAVETDKVNSTPTFEVNGKRIEGAVPLADLDAAIVEAEKAAKAPARKAPGKRPKGG